MSNYDDFPQKISSTLFRACTFCNRDNARRIKKGRTITVHPSKEIQIQK